MKHDAVGFTIKVVIVQSPSSPIITLNVFGSDTIDNVKGQIQALFAIRPKDQRIIRGCRQIDEGTLHYHKVEKNDTLRMVSHLNLFLFVLFWIGLTV